MASSVHVLPPPDGDQLTDLNADQLWNAQLLAQLACSRAHSSITRKRQTYFCYLGRVLKVEADRRALPSPPSTARTSDLRRL